MTGDTQVTLIDLMFGVVNGGWPFGALEANSSLFNNSSSSAFANINPSVPNLFLPSSV